MRRCNADRSQDRARPAAFTLLEVLVGVAVVALLVGILLPAISQARQAAWLVGSMSTQRTLAQGMLGYAASNDEWFPGLNTSGLNLWASNASPRTYELLSRRADRPVQNVDWITPSVAGSIDLPLSREQRFWTILETFADPAMPVRSPVYADAKPGSSEMVEWVEEHAPDSGGARGVSFLMSMNFQCTGGRTIRERQGPRHHAIGQYDYSGGELRRQFVTPEGYVPRTTLVGNPAEKIAFADGFRYLDTTARTIDFDASYSPFEWGSFGERTPVEQLSRSWGRLGGGGRGDNLPLAYRHAGRMDAAFFDGHVGVLTPYQSRNPALWAPRGSVFVGAQGTEPDALDYGLVPSRDVTGRSRPPESIVP